ncbi:MAG: hypothetical protein AYK18_10765 [Theionarchaea archaeon DG-70]|nr:MAG: hypothetical protein AYK18_10765 [Theionarchaea archaeon DG-70]
MKNPRCEGVYHLFLDIGLNSILQGEVLSKHFGGVVSLPAITSCLEGLANIVSMPAASRFGYSLITDVYSKCEVITSHSFHLIMWRRLGNNSRSDSSFLYVQKIMIKKREIDTDWIKVK